MKGIELGMLSRRYNVRRLNMADVEMIYDFCNANTQYYALCGRDITPELIEHDLQIAPPGIPPEQKYYIGFFEGEILVAVMDLIDGYPGPDCAFIGFFMMHHAMQGRGIGSAIVSEVLACLKEKGFASCRLGIDSDNPQSNHFWRKNGFGVIREVEQEEGVILLAERRL